MTDPITVIPGSTGILLMVDHNHGTDATVHANREDANDALHMYVSINWEPNYMDGKDLPADKDDAIHDYFQTMTEESFVLQDFTVF